MRLEQSEPGSTTFVLSLDRRILDSLRPAVQDWLAALLVTQKPDTNLTLQRQPSIRPRLQCEQILRLNRHKAAMRVAIVHHWYVSKGGGERVAEALASLYPQADLFALVADPAQVPDSLRSRKLITSFLDRLPFARRAYRHLLPLNPLAVEQLDLTGYDLVLSSDSGPMRNVIVSPSAVHICYCHSPMRYLWDQYHPYRSQMGVRGHRECDGEVGRGLTCSPSTARRIRAAISTRVAGPNSSSIESRERIAAVSSPKHRFHAGLA